ncbi:hypothetical protein Cpir12675_002196 [Ceratocystis pirilliformis]|uniref:Uncharacterized protein n=1 Tax=Ceratocystis pirilliformis TaxID=259994 RepID=A0ABR3ZAU3_9PEZI
MEELHKSSEQLLQPQVQSQSQSQPRSFPPHQYSRTSRPSHRRQWLPRFWPSFPFVNGVAVSDWPYPKVQPPTIVSLISAAGNHCLRVAIAEAVAVFFWKRAFQPFPLANVHHYWVAGQGIYCALQSIFKVTAFAILSLIIHTSTLARDPCFQNSIRINERLHHANGTISVPAASSLDNYFAGTMMGRAQNQAFGFNTECTSTTLPYNVSSYITTGEKMAEGLDLLNVDVSSMTYPGTNEGYLNVTVSRRPSLDCTGNMVVQSCFLYPATMKYNLQTDAGAVVFRNSSWKSDEFVANTSVQYFFS